MYQYQDLSSGEDHIRRLILEPGKGDAPLVGRLEEIRLSRVHDLYPFRTISYAWSSGIRNQTIAVEGKRLDITTSLRDSLRQTRNAYEPVALWADGICINQNDDKEKSRQVALMGQIFEASQRVLICLGLDPKYQQHASDIAGLIADVETLLGKVFEDPNFSWDWNSFPFPIEDEAIVHDSRWDSWGHLLDQPWFHRGWVVQEAALGPDGLVLWAGKEIRLESILRVNLFLEQRVMALNPNLNFWSIPHLQHLYNVRHPKEVRTFCTAGMLSHIEPQSALEILDSARELRLTDPRDRIYAFMALAAEDQAMPAVQPNYGKDVSHLGVYRDFATNYLEKASDLELLHFVEHEEELEENSPPFVVIGNARTHSLPSWVPRWDWKWGGSRCVDRDDRKITCSEGNRDNSRGWSISNVEGSPVLRVRAIVLDSVKYASETVKDRDQRDGPEREAMRVVSLWRNLAPEMKKYPGPHSGISGLAFLVALNHGLYDGDWKEYYQNLHKLARRLESDQPSDPADSHIQDPAMQRILVRTIEEARHRKFVILSRGYYGVAPKITREGDVCAIILGTRTPFILRRVSGKQDQYSVVGPTFVLSKKIGKSNGTPRPLAEDNSCDDWEDWGLETETITLV